MNRNMENASYETQMDVLNSLEKLGIARLKQGNKDYEAVVCEARRRRSALTLERLRIKLGGKFSEDDEKNSYKVILFAQ